MADPPPLTVTRLHPEPRADLAAGTIYDGLFDAGGACASTERPYVVVSMIASLDGHASRDGLSGALAIDRADREIFLSLRDQVDAVLAGTATIAAEGYRRLIPEAHRRAARRARGLAPEPLAVILSRSGNLTASAATDQPTSAEAGEHAERGALGLLDDPDQRRVIYTARDANPTDALRDLRTTHGVRTLLCEGGPRLNTALFDAQLVDELLLTVSPLVLGGDGAQILNGPPLPAPGAATLVSVFERHGSLFLRYRFAGPSDRVSGDG